jgi:hypothetical protein
MTQQYAPPAPTAGPGGGRSGLVPWLVAAVVLLVAALAVLLFVLLKADDDAPPSGDERVQAEEQLGDVDGDAVVPPDADDEQVPADEGTPYGGDGGAIVGSVDRGAAFMDDVVLADFPSAVGHGSVEFQARYGADESQLGMDIADITGSLPVNYTIDAVQYDEAVQADVLVLTVELLDGTYTGLDVIVGEEDGRAVVLGFQ